MLLLLSVLYLIPQLAVPFMNRGMEQAWNKASGIFRIPKDPGYVWKDMVIPSISVGISFIVLSFLIKKII